MESPWQILGLNADTSTEKDVKVAYAKLIKTHRPDSDPEGFRRVRDAYEAALSILKNGAKDDKFDDDEQDETRSFHRDDSPPPLAVSNSEESLPPELIEAELAATRARESKDEVALHKVVAGLQSLCRSLRPGQAGWQLWRSALHRLTEGRSALVAASLPVSQLIYEMEAGSAGITHVVIGQWEDEWDMDRLVALAEGILAEQQRLQNQEAGIAALRIAIAIGFVKPTIASTLASFAFPNLDREARDNLLPKVEEQSAVGKLMMGLRKDQQDFWHRRVRQPRFEWDWNSLQANEALNYLVREKGPHWSGYGIIKQIVPEEWFTRLEKEMGRVRGGITGRLKPPALGNPRPVGQPTKSGGGVFRFGWLLFLVLSSLARLLPHTTESSKPSSSRHYTPVPSLVLQTGKPITLAQAREHADKLRSTNEYFDFWLGRAREIDRESTLESEEERKLRQLFADVHNAKDRLFESRLVEVMIYDPSFSMTIRKMALIRMAEIMTPNSFLSKWQEVASISSRHRQVVGDVAKAYLSSGKVMMLQDERDALNSLAKGAR